MFVAMDFDVVCHVPLAYFPSNLWKFHVPLGYFFSQIRGYATHIPFFRDLGLCYVLLYVVLGFWLGFTSSFGGYSEDGGQHFH